MIILKRQMKEIISGKTSSVNQRPYGRILALCGDVLFGLNHIRRKLFAVLTLSSFIS